MSTVKRVTVVAGTAIVILGLAASGAQAHRHMTLFVSPHGSDSAAGTARAPMRTPQAAVDRLGRGTYGKQRIVLDGRDHVAILGSPGAVLDGAGLTVPDGQNGMVEIRNSSDVTVEGLGITGYRTTSLDAVPIGIFVTGSGHS